MKTGLAVLVGLLPTAASLEVAGQGGPKVPVTEFVRTTYFEGVPYDAANAYTPEVVPTLLDMLDDEAEAPYWANIAVTLSIIGDTRAVGPLIDFIERDVDGELPDWLYRAKANTVMALGYLVNKSGDRRALNYLVGAVDPDFWSEPGLGWVTANQTDVDVRGAYLSNKATIGLVLSGSEEAAETLNEMARSESLEVRSAGDGMMAELREAFDTISREGLSEYYRRAEMEGDR